MEFFPKNAAYFLLERETLWLAEIVKMHHGGSFFWKNKLSTHAHQKNTKIYDLGGNFDKKYIISTIFKSTESKEVAEGAIIPSPTVMSKCLCVPDDMICNPKHINDCAVDIRFMFSATNV